MPDRLGSRMPLALVEKHLWVQGGAFRRDWQFKSEGVKWRYFFILNKAPRQDDVLLVVTATTQIEKTVQRFGPALVVVNPDEYGSLERPSAINCAMPYEKGKEELVEAIRQGQIFVMSPLPDSVLQRVLKAVETATTISPKQKALILGDIDSPS